MKAVLYLCIAILLSKTHLFSAADIHCSTFLFNVEAFDYKLEHLESSTTGHLSKTAKDFAILSIIAHTQKVYSTGVQVEKILGFLSQANCGEFLTTVVKETWKHLKTKTTNKKQQQKLKGAKKAPAHKPKKHPTQQQHIKAPSPIGDELPFFEHDDSSSFAAEAGTCPLSLKVKTIFDIFEEFNTQKKELSKAASPKTKAASTFDLSYFEQNEPLLPEHPFLTKEIAREAVLFSWRKKVLELEAHLKKHLIGQNVALEKFCEGVFHHYSKLIKKNYVTAMRSLEMETLALLLDERPTPSTILITGPSGTGKTEMVKLTAGFLGKPIGCASGANLSPAGYVGDNPADAIAQLVRSAFMQVGDYAAKIHAEMEGIVFLDEVDKTAVRPGDERFKEGTQNALLTLVEGSQPLKMEGSDEFFNPSNVLFILAGAFSDMIPSRTNNHEESLFHLDHEALILYGLRPELVNRFKLIVQTNPLTPDNLFKILINPHCSPLYLIITEAKSFHRKDISFKSDALTDFCRYVEKNGIGARNLYDLLKELVEFSIKHHPEAQKINKAIVEDFRTKREAPKALADAEYRRKHGIV